jgi:hypothetical protein
MHNTDVFGNIINEVKIKELMRRLVSEKRHT